MFVFFTADMTFLRVYLIVLQQYEAEVELGEGQLQVLYVSVFASLLL